MKENWLRLTRNSHGVGLIRKGNLCKSLRHASHSLFLSEIARSLIDTRRYTEFFSRYTYTPTRIMGAKHPILTLVNSRAASQKWVKSPPPIAPLIFIFLFLFATFVAIHCLGISPFRTNCNFILQLHRFLCFLCFSFEKKIDK